MRLLNAVVDAAKCIVTVQDKHRSPAPVFFAAVTPVLTYTFLVSGGTVYIVRFVSAQLQHPIHCSMRSYCKVFLTKQLQTRCYEMAIQPDDSR